MADIRAVEDEVDKLNAVLIASAPHGEEWVKQYAKDPQTHAKIIKVNVKLERKLRRYFKDLADRSVKMINWSNYMGQIKADFNVDVIIDDSVLDNEDDLIMNIVFDPIAEGIYTGALAAQSIYNRPIGLTPTTDFVQQAARQQVANLVGKRLDKKTGVMIDNPNADYRITDTTRNEIRQSIATSLSLGEDFQTAMERMQSVIADPARAQMIAATESVNAYQQGLVSFGQQTDAVGQEWISSNPSDECGSNDDDGIIPFGESFSSGDSEPPAHPNCRCSLRLVYQEEMDNQ